MNELLEHAKQIGEENVSGTEQTTDTAEVDPPAGSFERFMSTFGNPSRWAGRS